LTTVKRPEVILRIKTAKELGDLKENADYTSAREEQSFLEGRIANIEGMLRTAVVIETPGADGRVHLGSEVSVEEVDGDGEVVVYRIVGSTEAKPAEGRISNSSPVGRALIGRSVGESSRHDASGRRRVPDRRRGVGDLIADRAQRPAIGERAWPP
jgi:transcription elongation factor GreA